MELIASNANAQGLGAAILFRDTPSHFSLGLTVQSEGGVILSESVTTKSAPTVIHANTGTLTVVAAKTLSTTSQLLTVTANDMDIGGAIDTGTADLVIECNSYGLSISLGNDGGQLALDASEVASLTAQNLKFGGAYCGDQLVSGVGVNNGLKNVDLLAVANGSYLSALVCSIPHPCETTPCL